MAELNATPECAANHSTRFKEAVCIEAGRIFDSCSDKDCLEDLQVFFTAEGQSVIDQSTLIKCKSAEALDVYLSVEPMPFNKGYFAVDVTFYFRVHFSGYASPVSTPVNVRGLACHTKKVILFGSEGGVKTFYSGERGAANNQISVDAMPVACLKAVDPITLGSRIVDCLPAYSEPLGAVPENVAAAFDGEILTQPAQASKTLLVTLGLFTIVTLERNVQLMIPAYDYVLPEKDCMTTATADDPYEMFKRIKFPISDFFPDDLNEASCTCVNDD